MVLIRRLGSAILMLFGLAALSFLMIRFLPGGPFDGDRAWPPEILRTLQAHYGLDRPVLHQLLTYFLNLARGDWGTSFHFVDRSVSELIREGAHVSIAVGLAAMLWSILGGLALAIGLTRARWRSLRSICYLLCMAFLSLPNYVVAAVLILCLAIGVPVFPVALWDESSSWVLPSLALAFKPAAMIARLLAETLEETEKRLFVFGARTRGFSERRIFFHHIARVGIVPTLTLLGPLAANLLTGSFVIETLFQIPGLGRHFVGSVLNRDYPMVSALTVLFGAILVFTNFAVDGLTTWLDPRVRFEDTE